MQGRSRILKVEILLLLLVLLPVTNSCTGKKKEEKQRKICKVWIIGDSTVANYALEDDYSSKRFPITGWGQVFQPFLAKDSLKLVGHLINADSVVVDDRAKGGCPGSHLGQLRVIIALTFACPLTATLLHQP